MPPKVTNVYISAESESSYFYYYFYVSVSESEAPEGASLEVKAHASVPDSPCV